MSEPTTRHILVAQVQIPTQRHRAVALDDGVRQLARDISNNGLIHPIAVRESSDGFALIAGHRRLLATAQVLGLDTIEARVYPALSDPTRAALEDEIVEISENLWRQNLTPLEEADHLSRYMALVEELGLRARAGRSEGVTMAEVGERLGVSERTARDRVAVAKIPREVRERVAETPIADKRSELLKLARLDGDERDETISALVAGDASRVDEARQLARRRLDEREAAAKASAAGGAGALQAARERVLDLMPPQPPRIIVWDTMSTDRWRKAFRHTVEGMGTRDVLVTPAPRGELLEDVGTMLRGLPVRHRHWVVVALDVYAVWSALALTGCPEDVLDLEELRGLLEILADD